MMRVTAACDLRHRIAGMKVRRRITEDLDEQSRPCIGGDRRSGPPKTRRLGVHQNSLLVFVPRLVLP